MDIQAVKLFQFQNGTIKSIMKMETKLLKKIFQFQNGTIKRKIEYRYVSFRTEFQFQNGTIKRIPYPLLRTYIRYFNSKMVRLRAN